MLKCAIIASQWCNFVRFHLFQRQCCSFSLRTLIEYSVTKLCCIFSERCTRFKAKTKSFEWLKYKACERWMVEFPLATETSRNLQVVILSKRGVPRSPSPRSGSPNCSRNLGFVVMQQLHKHR